MFYVHKYSGFELCSDCLQNTSDAQLSGVADHQLC